MHSDILAHLAVITAEEQRFLEGVTTIDRDIYMAGPENTIQADRLLTAGKLITIRPHTRFVDFPEHRHDYVEIVYMCSGSTTHLVNGKPIVLQEGDLLFLNQGATHSVLRAEETDIAVNFIVLPEFFSVPLTMIGQEQTPLRRFLVGCLCGDVAGAGYLHFRVCGIAPIQNLLENLLWSLIRDVPNKRQRSQLTVSLLLIELLAHTETLTTHDREDALVWQVLSYVEAHYVRGDLARLARQLHYDIPWLSRKIKQKTGRTFTQLIQEKRLTQAAFLLRNTGYNIADISTRVGYENISYFHRLFARRFGVSPKSYRDMD